jgi:acetylornithine deacetylase/succinyl-diaminopimelate desuccinylase-like protein
MENWVAAAGAIGLLGAMPAAAQEPRPDQVRFRELYKELVETNTTLSSGSCTLAAERMGARLKAAGYADSELTYEATQAALEQAIGNPKVKVTRVPPIRPLAKPPPLEPKVLGPMEKLAARYYPGVPVIPSMTTGGTDGVFLGALGIPVYGVPGLWMDPDANGAHGLNERMEVRALYTGRDYLTELVKTYANAH